MPVTYCSSATLAIAPTLFDTAPTYDSDDDYEEHEGVKGLWMMRCSCGNEFNVGPQCYGSEECGDYELFFSPRPFWTTRRHRRNMRLFRGVAWAIVRLEQSMLRAADRVHEPGSATYCDTRADYEEKRGLLMGEEALPAAKRARA
jgi:hypothetical protein